MFDAFFRRNRRVITFALQLMTKTIKNNLYSPSRMEEMALTSGYGALFAKVSFVDVSVLFGDFALFNVLCHNVSILG